MFLSHSNTTQQGIELVDGSKPHTSQQNQREYLTLVKRITDCHRSKVVIPIRARALVLAEPAIRGGKEGGGWYLPPLRRWIKSLIGLGVAGALLGVAGGSWGTRRRKLAGLWWWQIEINELHLRKFIETYIFWSLIIQQNTDVSFIWNLRLLLLNSHGVNITKYY